MCLRGVDASLKDSQGATVVRADEQASMATVTFRKTKTDQRAFGACRCHYRSGEAVSPVDAFEILRRAAPERFVNLDRPP